MSGNQYSNRRINTMQVELLRNRSSYVIMIVFWVVVTNIVVEATGFTANHFSTPPSIISSTSVNRDNNYEEFDPEEMLKIGTNYCKSKSSCSGTMFESFPGKSCYCDKICAVLDDCCSNFNIETEATTLKNGQFSCVRLTGIIKNENYGVHMVTKCSEKWEHNNTKLLCEKSTNSTDDIFLKLPVSHKSVMYQNMYCAQCNFMSPFEYWKAEMMCQNATGVRSLPDRADCDLFFIPPRPDVGYRKCQLRPRVIESCLDTDTEYTIETKGNCTYGDYNIVYDSSGNAYRNEQCASCNGYTGDLFCEIPEPSNPFNNTPTHTPRKVYSFRILVDFNKGTVNKNGSISNIGNCKDNELYDSFSEKCREIFCPPPLLPVKGVCLVNDTHITNETVLSPQNCSLVKLDSSEYIITNDSRLFILSSNKTYPEDEFQVFENDVFVCLTSCTNNCDNTDTLFQYDALESYLSMAGLIISIASLAVTLIVYATFSQLMNTPGRILVCLMTALLIAQLLFLIAAVFENIVQLCIAVALLTHYFYLSSFCWMNVIALDLWMTFSNSFMSGGSRRNNRRFLKYSLYAWLTPLLIVICAVIFDFSPINIEDVSLKPQYGVNVCWFSSKNGLLLFFAGPLAVLKLFDIISFIFTAVHITRTNRQGAMAGRKSRSCSLLINIKLSLIMGLTWVFAFIANITNETVIWYLFIVFNSLQGLFIAVCFLCTRKVGRILYDKYEKISSKSTSGTKLSSLSQSAKT